MSPFSDLSHRKATSGSAPRYASLATGTIASSPLLYLQRPCRVRITLVTEIPDDPSLRLQWNALASQVWLPQIFYTYEWARAVQLALGETLHPLLLLARDETQQLVGVAALATSTSGGVSCLCATTGDYCDFLARRQDAAVFVNEALRALRDQGYRNVTLTNFPEDSPSFDALRSAAANSGFQMYARTAYLCAQIQISAIPTNAAGKPQLPRQKMVRRCLKAMAEDGPLAIVHETTFERVDLALSEFFRAHVARFLFTGRISNLVRPERRKFLCELARLLSDTGWLCLSQIRVGSRTISWNYGFKFEKNWFWYQPTFVNDLEKYSPGFVLLSKVIEEAASGHTYGTVDMGLGIEGYKDRFANNARRTMYVTLHHSLSWHWKEIARHRAATAVTGIPRAEKAVRTLIATGNALGRRLLHSGIGSTCAWGLRRARRPLSRKEEVFFFEAGSCSGEPSAQFQLRPISYEVLADTAIQYFDDDQTLSYLVRCAARLRAGCVEGFALVDSTGHLVHLAWVTSFAGFVMDELHHKLDCSNPARMMLFDCWTPVSQRGHGYYAETIRRIAQLQISEGKHPWIFSAASNASSRRSIVKAGFQLRYSLVSRNTLGWHRIEQRFAGTPEAAAQV
jgi:CelD/BcsL family acetyltransferase involved in cellulose biosynthesis